LTQDAAKRGIILANCPAQAYDGLTVAPQNGHSQPQRLGGGAAAPADALASTSQLTQGAHLSRKDFMLHHICVFFLPLKLLMLSPVAGVCLVVSLVNIYISGNESDGCLPMFMEGLVVCSCSWRYWLFAHIHGGTGCLPMFMEVLVVNVVLQKVLSPVGLKQQAHCLALQALGSPSRCTSSQE